MWEIEKFWSNSYNIIFQQWQYNLLQDDRPVSSAVLLPFFSSASLPSIVSTPLFSPLFGLSAQGAPFLFAVEVGFLP